MTKRFLLTSFNTWLREQESNSSDDLLAAVSQVTNFPYSLSFLRQLPVDISAASEQVITQISLTQPDFVIACGMAATRDYLSVESNATNCSQFNSQPLLIDGENENFQTLHTSIDLAKLLTPLPKLSISHDCGKFVCEGLYYAILDYLNKQRLNIQSPFQSQTQCIFVHVPILTLENQSEILDDFLLIIHQLALL